MTEKQVSSPKNVPFLEKSGQVNKQWLYFLEHLRTIDDTIKQPQHYVFTNTSAVLTERHFGKIIIFENGANDVNCTLPHIGSSDKYSWIDVYRLGTGRLTVIATDLDKIELSSYGGKVYCDEKGRMAANLRFMVVRENLWAIVTTGIWKTA